MEGLLHVSELSDQKVENPETFVKVGQELDVRILRIDSNDRKIGLSRRSTAEIQASTSEEAKSEPAAPKARTELKGGMEGASGPLFTMGETPEVAQTEEPATEAVHPAD